MNKNEMRCFLDTEFKISSTTNLKKSNLTIKKAGNDR